MSKEIKAAPQAASAIKPIFGTRVVCFLKHTIDTKLSQTVLSSDGLTTAFREQACSSCGGIVVGIALFREVLEPDEIIISVGALTRAMKPADRFGQPDGSDVEKYRTILTAPFERIMRPSPWR